MTVTTDQPTDTGGRAGPLRPATVLGPSPAAEQIAPGGEDEIVTSKPDCIEAWSRTMLMHLLWVGTAAIALGLQFVRGFDGLYLSQAMDLAQIARHLSAGHGYVTSFLRPVAIGLYPHAPAPEICNAPLYPLMLGLVFGALPQTDAVVAGVSAFFFAATVGMIYLLASRVFDRAVGILAAVIFALNGQALVYAISGLHVTLWAFLLALAVYLAYASHDSAPRSIAAGAVLGLAWLTEYMTFALVIPMLLTAYYAHSTPAAHRPSRLRRLAWFALGLVAVAIPWWVRNSIVAHDPFFTLQRYTLAMFTSAHPGFTLFRSTDSSALGLSSLVASAPLSLVKKWILGLASAHRTLPMLVGPYVIGFLVVALLRPLGAPRRNQVRTATILLLVFLAIIGAFFNPTAELFFVVAPLVTVLCGGYFVMLLRGWVKRPGRQALAYGVFVVVAAYPALMSWAAPQPPVRVNRVNLDFLSRALPPKAILVTDAPWAVAWYADRSAVWLPLTPEDFETVQKRLGVDAVYFTSLLATYPPSESAQIWQSIFAARAAPPGFAAELLPQPGEALMVRGGGPAGAAQSLPRASRGDTPQRPAP
jgi:4-amino-4-deoxy-L-arabinose transferase-like glycosyltransferase